MNGWENNSDSLLNRGGRVFELLAMDVVLDRQTRPWLLKLTDTVPSLQAETNLKYAMKERMVMDMLRMVGCVSLPSPPPLSAGSSPPGSARECAELLFLRRPEVRVSHSRTSKSPKAEFLTSVVCVCSGMRSW